MRTRLIAAFAALAACTAAWPQQRVLLDFGSPGKRKVWIQTSMPLSSPQAAQTVEGPTFAWNIRGAPQGSIIFVYDESTGNLCARPLTEAVKNGKIQPKDFGLVMEVAIRLEHKGKPVESATVTLQDSKRKQTQVLDSSARGELHFWAVAPGTLKVEVLYRTRGEMADPLVASFEVGLERAKPVPEFVVSIPDPVATVELQEPDAGLSPSRQAPSKIEETGGPLGSLIALLVTLAIVGGIGYCVFLWLKKNPDRVKAHLQRLGVEVAEPQGSVDATETPVLAPSPASPRKIILQDAEPNVGSPAPPPASLGERRPRLVRENGQAFELVEGSTILGREEDLPISLTAEPTVSRRHAELVCAQNQVLLKDLGSTNGTFVNGAPVQGEVVLEPGDEVQFGAVRFRFEA